MNYTNQIVGEAPASHQAECESAYGGEIITIYPASC